MKASNGSSYLEVQKRASSFLMEQGVNPDVARWLMQERFNLSQTDLIIKRHDTMSDQDYLQYVLDIKQAAKHYPPQYIVGHEWFYNRQFKLTTDTLIPRPETEEWFDRYINKLDDPPLTVVDVGTGSGVLGISHKLQRPQDKVYVTDISPKALKVATRNAKNLQADIHILEGNLLEPIIDRQIDVDLIISNPPYISKHEWGEMDESVRQYEPKLALFAENNGLAAYQTLINQSVKLVSSKYKILLEIGYQQGQAVKDLVLHTYPQASVKIWTDFNGLDRLVSIII